MTSKLPDPLENFRFNLFDHLMSFGIVEHPVPASFSSAGSYRLHSSRYFLHFIELLYSILNRLFSHSLFKLNKTKPVQYTFISTLITLLSDLISTYLKQTLIIWGCPGSESPFYVTSLGDKQCPPSMTDIEMVRSSLS